MVTRIVLDVDLMDSRIILDVDLRYFGRGVWL